MNQCEETWSDEVGCDQPGPHHCERDDEHRRHRCECGALIIEDRPDLTGLLALSWRKTRWIQA